MKVLVYGCTLAVETTLSVSAQVFEGVGSSLGWAGLAAVVLTAIPSAHTLANALFDHVHREEAS